MIICSTVRNCCCQGLLRVHESLRNTLPAFTPMQCHSECSLDMCPPFNQALTRRIGNAQEEEEEGGWVCAVFAGRFDLTGWLRHCISWCGSAAAASHRWLFSVDTSPPSRHASYTQWAALRLWCVPRSWYHKGEIHLINESIVIVLPAPHPDTQINKLKTHIMTWQIKESGGSPCRCDRFLLIGDHMCPLKRELPAVRHALSPGLFFCCFCPVECHLYPDLEKQTLLCFGLFLGRLNCSAGEADLFPLYELIVGLVFSALYEVTNH